MAVFKKPVPAVVYKAAVKPVVKPISDGFQVVSIDSIEFLASGRGGGKPMNPAVARLIEKALTLEIGQGIKIPIALRIEKQIPNANGVTSTLHTYKGAQTLSKKSKAYGLRFRTRRDVSNNLWLFSAAPLATPLIVVEHDAEE